jgi:predicted oxidoreductase
MVREGVDKDFGRARFGGEIATPPFYAVTFYPLARKSMGGIRIDTDARVLDKSAKPIAGFLAAGEVTGFGGINGKRLEDVPRSVDHHRTGRRPRS